MKKSNKIFKNKLNNKYIIITILYTLLFSIIINFMNVYVLRINVNILTAISEIESQNRIIEMCIFAIIIQLLLFAFKYIRFYIDKTIYYTQCNKYTNSILQVLFYGMPNQIYKFNKSEIVYISTDLVYEYIYTLYNLLSIIVENFIGILIYCIYFRKDISFVLIILAISIYIIVYISSIKINKKISVYIANSLNIQNTINTLISEFIDNAEDIKLAGIQNRINHKLDTLINNYKINVRKNIIMNMASSLINEIPNILLNVGIFIYIYFVFINTNLLEKYFLIIPLVFSLVSFLKVFTNVRPSYIKQKEIKNKIVKFTEIEKEKLNNKNEPYKINKVTAKNLKYSYDDKKYIEFPDIEEVEKPSIVLIQGNSGSGKTTFLGILSGLLTPDQGNVIFETEDNIILEPKQIRSEIGYIPQSGFIYKSSIRENITLGYEYSDYEIKEALKKANALDFVMKKPLGLDTIIGLDGNHLSGGEKQRILISRTLIRNPQVLFLDESLSGLDFANSQDILNRLKEDNMICFIVSHNHISIFQENNLNIKL